MHFQSIEMQGELFELQFELREMQPEKRADALLYGRPTTSLIQKTGCDRLNVALTQKLNWSRDEKHFRGATIQTQLMNHQKHWH